MAVTSKVTSGSGGGRQIKEAIEALLKKRLLVGIPAEGAERQPEPGEKTTPNNATLGYLNEFGDDEKHIPARPFLVPGVDNAKPAIVGALTKAAQGAFAGDMAAVDDAFIEAGLAAERAVKAKLQAGPYAPLSERTIRERAERRYADSGKLVGNRPNRQARQFLALRREGVPEDVLHDAGLAQPLVDTRSLLNSIKHVVTGKE